ncbi:MAG TPA: glycerophosphodiester phosphodiesterase family protein [Oscillospiraceae bacterium]|jgi:glycerophosphoryl diester phosphodiesterase|nr:glycerophosphodiester phosphodiesterase family protein [Oscillospiraceae bacterium]HRW57156.1 glycerophosphodiester phosphodiesterase family protein [Oscillospiraceae bacterium]
MGFTTAITILIIIFLLLALAIVWMTTPNRRRPFDLPLVWAHRGLHDETKPENSLAAFRAAAEKGLGSELDVRLTKDGMPVVFHDTNTACMCGIDRVVGETDWAVLREFRLSGTEEHIPLLSEALEAMDGAPLLCELKYAADPADCTICEKVMPLLDAYDGPFVIESFSPYILRWFRENRPDIIRGQLSCDLRHLTDGKRTLAFLLGNLFTNFLARPDFLSWNFRDSTFGFRLCRYYGTRIAAWTLHSADEVGQAVEAGASSFIAENFDLSEVFS